MENEKKETEQFLQIAGDWGHLASSPDGFGQYLKKNFLKESKNRFIIKKESGIVLARFTLKGKNPKIISGMLTNLSLNENTFSFTIIGGPISGGSGKINMENLPIDNFTDITIYQTLPDGVKFVIQGDWLVKIEPIDLNFVSEVKEKEKRPCVPMPV